MSLCYFTITIDLLHLISCLVLPCFFFYGICLSLFSVLLEYHAVTKIWLNCFNILINNSKKNYYKKFFKIQVFCTLLDLLSTQVFVCFHYINHGAAKIIRFCPPIWPPFESLLFGSSPRLRENLSCCISGAATNPHPNSHWIFKSAAFPWWRTICSTWCEEKATSFQEQGEGHARDWFAPGVICIEAPWFDEWYPIGTVWGNFGLYRPWSLSMDHKEGRSPQRVEQWSAENDSGACVYQSP